MKKTILNIAAIAVIATTSFIACDKKQATDDAAAVDSANVGATDSTNVATPEAAPETAAPEAADSTTATSAPKAVEAAPKAEEAK